MTADETCDRVRELIPELAIGVASGEERAQALSHLAGCKDCRRELEEMAQVADELLLLAPEREPSIGFESRVLDQLTGLAVTRPRRWRAVALGVAASLALAALSAGLVYRATDGDRLLAAQYREVLRRFDGEYFQSAALTGSPSGADGQVFGYQGSPSWMFLIVPGQAETDVYRIKLETRSGRRIDLGSVEVTSSGGSWGKTIPVDLGEAARVWLKDGFGHVLQAQFAHWGDHH
jgi:hypothetical protein